MLCNVSGNKSIVLDAWYEATKCCKIFVPFIRLQHCSMTRCNKIKKLRFVLKDTLVIFAFTIEALLKVFFHQVHSQEIV